MPTIAVDKAALFKELGREYTTEEFDELCFQFGIELDEDTTNSTKPEDMAKPPQLKIEIPANRYDMLCFEGIALNLKVFLGQCELPKWTLSAKGELEVLEIKEETMQIRPLCSGVVIRNITFTQERYDSFISLQDKLHANLARQRTLVSIGTHDLDTIKGPFTYEALPPEQIKFIPLNQTKEMNGKELIEFYEKDKHLSKFLHIIRDSPVYPVIYDSKRTVLSLPPIINGNHSKITLETTNVFVEITATDKTKLEVVNHMLVAMLADFAQSIEPVKILSPHNGESREAPDLSPREMQAEVEYLNRMTGLNLSPDEISKILSRMGYAAKPSPDPKLLDVSVPINRADVLHQADIMEDYAIGYGFNKLPRELKTTYLIPSPLPIEKLSDIVRREAASLWIEAMPLTLCSHQENFEYLNRTDDGTLAVKLANPKTAEYQVVRTSLLPGLLKTTNSNKHQALPIKIFEVGDVCLIDMDSERKSRNERRFAASIMGKTSEFEQVHALLTRLMIMLRLANRDVDEKGTKLGTYWLEEVDDPTFLKGHAATIKIDFEGKQQTIGSLGVLHPSILKNFKLPFPVSIIEFVLEPFL